MIKASVLTNRIPFKLVGTVCNSSTIYGYDNIDSLTICSIDIKTGILNKLITLPDTKYLKQLCISPDGNFLYVYRQCHIYRIDLQSNPPHVHNIILPPLDLSLPKYESHFIDVDNMSMG